MTSPLLTKRPIIRLNNHTRRPRRDFSPTSLLALAFALATLASSSLPTARGQNTQTAGWSTRQQVAIRSTSDVSQPGLPINRLHRRKLNWSTPPGQQPAQTFDAFRNTADDSAPTYEHRQSLRRSLQHHARSRPTHQQAARTVAHHSQPADGAQPLLQSRSSHVPATPWDDGHQPAREMLGTVEADPFDDPFRDKQLQRRNLHRTESAGFGQATSTATGNVFDAPSRSNHRARLFALKADENALTGFQQDSDLQPETPTIPEFTLPPADPPFKDLRPQDTREEPRPKTDAAPPADDLTLPDDQLPPVDELPPPMQPIQPRVQVPSQDLPVEDAPRLDSPFDPSDTPLVPDEGPIVPDEGEIPRLDLEDIQPFQDDAEPEMPPVPKDDFPEMDDFPQPEEELPAPPSSKPTPDAEVRDEDEFEFDRDRQRDQLFDELPRRDADEPPFDESDRDLDQDLNRDLDRERKETASDEVPCDRNYNDRNCCREDRECVTILDRLGERTISTISLDITPPFVIQDGTSDDEDPEAIKAKKLAEIPRRTWLNRQGRAVASGYLDDFRDGKVLIRSDEGGITAIPFSELSRDDLCFVTAFWNLPAECPLPGDDHVIRDFTMLTFAWTASGQCHKPLYFENVALERYGHSAGPCKQHFWSAAHFFGSAIMLPYSCGLYPPNECRYALGYYEPGDCAPWIIHAFPLSKRAALSELKFILGLWGAIP